MIRQEPNIQFLYENVDITTFNDPVSSCQESEFAAFEDVHIKTCLRVTNNADLEIRLRRDGPPEDHWLAKGTIKVFLWNQNFEISGTYPATFCNEKPFHILDMMSKSALKCEIGDEVFNVDIGIKFEKWEGLKLIKLFQFDHEYLDSDLKIVVQGRQFFMRSETLFKEIPAFRDYLEQLFGLGEKCYILKDLQGERTVAAIETMLQLAFRCSFITNINEVGEVLTLAFRFNYPALTKKCEYYLINEPKCNWIQKLVFSDLYNLPLLRKHVLDTTVGLSQICKNLHLNRFFCTDTIRMVMQKASEMNRLKKFGDEELNKGESLLLNEITENRWERLKRLPLTDRVPGPDVTAAVEKFESNIMPKHFGVDLIGPEFCFSEKSLNMFNFKVQLGPDHRLLLKIEWRDVQTGNFVWSVNASIFVRMSYQINRKWECSERVRFDHDNQAIFLDGLHIQDIFPGGVEHLLDGLGDNSSLPKIEIMVVVEKIRGLELQSDFYNSSLEDMDDEWILQPSRNSPIVCCGKYLYVDKDVLRSKSAVFSKIFEQTYEPITIPMTHEKFESFSSFVDILHGEEVFLNYQNVFLIVEHARSFRVEEVLTRAVNFIIEEPGMSNLEKLRLAEEYGIPELQKNIAESLMSLDELFEMTEDVNSMSRRILQIVQDRLTNLPLPSDDFE